MNETLLDATIVTASRLVDLGSLAEEADRQVWASAAAALKERSYGAMRVVPDWSDRSHVKLRLIGDGDAAKAAELFLHDAFLMFNLAAPGSFGGTFSLGGGDAVTLDPRLFEYAWATAVRNGAPRIEPIDLSRVVAWLDTAEPPVARALFHLLHLARQGEDELLSIVRLAKASEELGLSHDTLNALRDAPPAHPALDDEEASLARIDAADTAASAIVSAIQARIVAAA